MLNLSDGTLLLASLPFFGHILQSCNTVYLGGTGNKISQLELILCVMKKINVPTATVWSGMEVRALKYAREIGNSINIMQFLAL
jgi:hypothetical protein